MRIRLAVLLSVAASFSTFLVVQDVVTKAGSRRYVALQEDALAGRGPIVRIDDIMRPVVRRSVRQGLLWGGLVLAGGLSVAGWMRRASRSAGAPPARRLQRSEGSSR